MCVNMHPIRIISIFILLALVMPITHCTNAAVCNIKELGIKVPNTKRIPDKHMTSSSQQNSRYPASRGRIGVESIGSWGNAWCSSESDADPYIQVFFELLTHLAVVESEGVTIDGNKMWVKSYAVTTSNDSSSWTTYPEGNARELQANTDVQAVNVTLTDTWAHYIRIHPKKPVGTWTCMRIAVYGCQTGKDGLTMITDVLNDAPFDKTPLKETLFLVIPIVLFGCLLISGIMCLCCRYRARRSQQGKPTSRDQTAEIKRELDNGVMYEKPPPYESQVVSIDFGHDIQDGKEMQSEMPAFNESNKIFSFERNAAYQA